MTADVLTHDMTHRLGENATHPIELRNVSLASLLLIARFIPRRRRHASQSSSVSQPTWACPTAFSRFNPASPDWIGIFFDSYQFSRLFIMDQVAKIFTNGRSQAVRLPVAYRFDAKEVFIRQDPQTGDVILSRRPTGWDDFFVLLKGADVPEDFLSEEERCQPAQNRDPLAGWSER
jgi:antitoxin VapB